MLLNVLFFQHSIFLFLTALVGDFGLCFELAEPAEEQGRHHSQVYQSRKQQQCAACSLIGEGGNTELWRDGIMMIKHHKGEDQQKGENVHRLTIQEGVQHLLRVSHPVHFAYWANQRPPVEQGREQETHHHHMVEGAIIQSEVEEQGRVPQQESHVEK